MEGTDLHDGFGGYLSGLFEQMVTNLISSDQDKFGIDNNSRSVEKTSTLLIYSVYSRDRALRARKSNKTAPNVLLI